VARTSTPLTVTIAPQQDRKPVEPWRRENEQRDEGGPERPDVNRPNREKLMKRMRRVDRDQSKRYRQRTGE
jgi:hypothetical protein